MYNGSFFYAIWNDQFKGAPTRDKDAPWGHSKGMAAWNSAGEGFVMQVSTPSWPGAGNKDQPRKNDGNTLGCVKDNDIKVSQHFFALKVTRDDLAKVLKALQTASVVTDSKIVRWCATADRPIYRSWSRTWVCCLKKKTSRTKSFRTACI